MSTTVNALDRGLSLLQCFSPEKRALSISDLARASGIPRPSVTRLAATLVQHRWLYQEPEGERYMLGAGVVTLAQVFLAGLNIRALARPAMQALAEACDGTVYLGVRDGLEMVIIEACRGSHSMFNSKLDVGSRVPMPNSSLGRAYLAKLDADEHTSTLQALRKQQGRQWPPLHEGLMRSMLEHQRKGWCLSAGELHAEVNSVSAAIQGPRGELLAFNCGGPAASFTEKRLRNEVAPALRKMVQGIALHIGGKA
jgi:IclR family transcriptional regulator, positive regulator for flagellar biogenesis